jgi:UDP-N-acetylmuramate-alanine ligase
MKKILLFLILALAVDVNAQSFNEDKTSFSNFIKRMYTATPFEGVKIVDDYDHQYLVSIISLDKAKYSDPSIMNRVAQVKAQSQANTFLNGASIRMDMIIKTTEKTSKDSISAVVETIEQIKQNSVGFTQGLELLTNFDNADNKRMVFVYMRELIKEKK